MDMHIADANDAESLHRLAAIHSRNASSSETSSCYVCHKDYGMFGYAMTKLGGMGHVYMFLSEYMWYDDGRGAPQDSHRASLQER